MNNNQPSNLNTQENDPALETPVERDPDKIYPYAIFLKKSAPTTKAANQDAHEFAESVGINLVTENIFRMGDRGINLLIKITPKKAAELEKDPRVLLI
jgi:hypothetical protein